jgi:release factor glutamine methyltransferase
MTRRELYRKVQSVATELYGEQEGCAVADRLTEDIYSFGRFEVVLAGELEVEGFDSEVFERVLTRLRTGEPVQYIVGHTEFLERRFAVRKGVLIPRPETEELVMHIVRRCGAGARILDVGTGSGAIAISLAGEIPSAEVVAIDLSPVAVEVARENALSLGVEVTVRQQDIFTYEPSAESFDVIVSNPPYIPLAEREEMERNVVDFEPSEALFVPDESPLLFYERIADVAKVALKEGGLLCFEIHERLSEQSVQMLADKGFRNIELLHDLNSKPRMIICQK